MTIFWSSNSLKAFKEICSALRPAFKLTPLFGKSEAWKPLNAWHSYQRSQPDFSQDSWFTVFIQVLIYLKILLQFLVFLFFFLCIKLFLKCNLVNRGYPLWNATYGFVLFYVWSQVQILKGPTVLHNCSFLWLVINIYAQFLLKKKKSFLCFLLILLTAQHVM